MNESIPYRPLPPICTIPAEQRRVNIEPAKPERNPLTGDQLINWRRLYPLAMFLSDAEINELRNQIEDATHE